MDSRVDGSEVALDTPDLLFEDLVPEPRLELSLPEGGRCNAHGVLATTEKHLCTQISTAGYG